MTYDLCHDDFFKCSSAVKMSKTKKNVFSTYLYNIRVLCLLCYIICWRIRPLDEMQNKENDTVVVIEVYTYRIKLCTRI